MRLKIMLAIIAIAVVSSVGAQIIPKFKHIPKNDEKQYEYSAQLDVDRAGQGDIMERLKYWNAVYYAGSRSSMSVDTADKTNLLMDVEVPFAESHFNVSRVHKDRKLKYHLEFKCDRKDYTYKVNGFEYAATETYPKGTNQLSGNLKDMKSPASASVEEEVDRYIQEVISSFKEYANTSLEDLKNPKTAEETEDLEMDEPEVEEVETIEEEEIVAPKLDKVKQKKAGASGASKGAKPSSKSEAKPSSDSKKDK